MERELTHEELREEAHRLAKDDSRAYTEIAEELDVTKNAVAKAVTTTGPKFHRLQIRTVELLSNVEVERATRFHVNGGQSSDRDMD